MYSQEFLNRVIEFRKDLHAMPELAFKEFETSRYIREKLSSMGFKVESVADTGLIAYMEDHEGGSAICFRADMDGLNIKEETDKKYSSKNGNMHACGHDGHMAILLGFANYIAESKIKKNIKLLFQPGEESAGGADFVMKDGVFKKQCIDKIYGLHIQPEIEEGKIGVKSGAFMAQTIELDIMVKGKSSHGAQPHKGIDSIYVASQLIGSYQSIISRNVAPLDAAVLTIGKIEGGSARNIIADRVKMEGTLRSFDENVYLSIKKRLEEVNRGLENMYGVKISTQFMDYCPPVVNDPQLYMEFIKYFSEDEMILMEPMTISEDFGFYQREIKGFYFMLGSRNAEKGYVYPLHSSKFDFNEEILIRGIEAFKRIAEIKL